MSGPKIEIMTGEVYIDFDKMRSTGIVCFPGIDCPGCKNRDNCQAMKDHEQAVKKCSEGLARKIEDDIMKTIMGRP